MRARKSLALMLLLEAKCLASQSDSAVMMRRSEPSSFSSCTRALTRPSGVDINGYAPLAKTTAYADRAGGVWGRSDKRKIAYPWGLRSARNASFLNGQRYVITTTLANKFGPPQRGRAEFLRAIT